MSDTTNTAADTSDEATNANAESAAGDKATPNTENKDNGKAQGDDLPDWARAQLTKANKEAARYRTEAKAAAEKAQQETVAKLLGALGRTPDGDKAAPTADELAKELEAKSKAERQALTELAVYKHAAKAGANPELLLDSRTFIDGLKDIDLADTDALTAHITETVKAHPYLSGKKTPGGSSSVDHSARSGEGEITAERFARMGMRERTQLKRSNQALYDQLVSATS